MNFKVERVNTEDFYPVMCKWWDQKKFPNHSLCLLPKNTFVCYLGEDPIYSICFYFTDSDLAWIAWPIANSEVPKDKRSGGLSYLLAQVEIYAKEQGFKMIFTTTPLEVIAEVLGENDFVLGDQNVNHYYKLI